MGWGERIGRETGVQVGREQPLADHSPEGPAPGRATSHQVLSRACVSWLGDAFARPCYSPASGSGVSKLSPRERTPAQPHPDEAVTGHCRPSCPPAHHPSLPATASHGRERSTGSGGADGPQPPRMSIYTRVCSGVLLVSSRLGGIEENPNCGDLNERFLMVKVNLEIGQDGANVAASQSS